jgi:hypothetical protein
MLKKICIFAVLFVFLAQNVFAAASCGCVKSAAAASAAKISAAISSSTSSIVGSLQSLLRDNKGMNVAQAVREFQATSTQDSANVAKQLTAALDGLQANLIAFEQRRQAYESAKHVQDNLSSISQEECSGAVAKKTAPLAQATQSAYSVAGGNVARTASGGAKTLYQVAGEMIESRREDPRALDGGIVTRPGCTPKMSEETAYADGLPIVGGYECPAPNLTIPEEDAEKAAHFVARAIIPNPIPELPANVRNTTSGALYEAERDKVRMRQSYLLDVAEDSLSKFQATRDLSSSKDFFTLMGVSVPDKVSEMDYLRYHLLSRWDNVKFQAFQKTRSQADLLRDMHESILLLTSMQFRQLELAERKTLAEIQFYEAVQDGPSRAKLEGLRQQAGL